MASIRLFGAVLATLLLSGSTMAEQCKFAGKDDETINPRMGQPVIEGQPFVVPLMNWRFESLSPPTIVEVRYQWQWIDYPYPEHPFGAWLTSEEMVECQMADLSLQVPAWTVRPRGWYKGKYTSLPWSKPRFHQVEFKIVWERNCSQTILLSPRMLGKFRDHDAVLKRSCGAPEEIKFIRNPK